MSDCLIYYILSNGEAIKYHKVISVVTVIIEHIVICLNTGPEDRLTAKLRRLVYRFALDEADMTFLISPMRALRI